VRTTNDALPSEVVVEVRDNGVGVRPADRQKIFERFYRATATADGVEGSGIGLTIVQDVVASIGGRVWAEFPDSGGSIFAIALPMGSASRVPITQER
jgi:signal transduction histidine kinase